MTLRTAGKEIAERRARLLRLPSDQALIVQELAGHLADRVTYLSHDGALEVLSAIGAALSRHHLRIQS